MLKIVRAGGDAHVIVAFGEHRQHSETKRYHGYMLRAGDKLPFTGGLAADADDDELELLANPFRCYRGDQEDADLRAPVVVCPIIRDFAGHPERVELLFPDGGAAQVEMTALAP